MTDAASDTDSHSAGTIVPSESLNSSPSLPAAPEMVPLGQLLPAISPRVGGEDEDHIIRLAETETSLPPILVHRSTMRIIDGMHRWRAAALKGRQEIEVAYFDGTDAEAFIQAVRENTAHGLPLSLEDRKAAAGRIIASHPMLSDRSIANDTGLSGKTVAAIRRASAGSLDADERIGADGRLRPLTASDGRRRASEIIEANPEAPLREVAKAARVSLGTAHDVRRRMRSGEDPVPSRAREAGPAAMQLTPVIRPSAERLKSLGTMLESLARDPSLRHTEPGRELLLRLRAGVMTPDDWARLIEGVPAHCREAVAETARQCAEIWSQFADQLDRRTVVPG